MTIAAIQAEALHRATTGQSWANVPAIIAGFTARGIPESDVLPRENVLTYQAWLALGRQVRRGEHGVKVFTRIPIGPKTDPATGEVLRPAGTAARSTTVFHISQTDPVRQSAVDA
jgi:antirestriction protein ArdC